MKILILDMDGCRYPSLGYQIKTGLMTLGHEVVTFDYRKLKLQHISISNQILNRLMVHTAKTENVNLVIVNKGETILPGTIADIKKLGIVAVNWEPDEPFGLLAPFNKLKNIDEYDAFFIYDKQYIDELLKINVNTFYLPPGADPFGIHKESIPLDQREYTADLCLVGTAYAKRIKLLQGQLSRRMLIAGPGWEKAPAPLCGSALPLVKMDEMVKIFNKSKIVLNPYGESKAFIVPNPRTFEIPATRSFELTDASRDVDQFFRIGKELVVYHDEKEFNELVDYYLANDKERTAIVEAGYRRVLEEHTIVHRLRQLLKTIKL